MLQPLQLKDVSLRYPGEIAELRDFLGKTGFALGTAGTLSAVAASLQRDRAFHRDLILHVWVLIDRCGGQISPSDLLGVLAIAAAGQQFAAEASEDDAHDLLRFVMEARRSMDAPTAARATGPQRVADVGRPAEFVPAVEPSEAPSPVAPPTSPQPPVIPTRRITSPAPPLVTAEPSDLRYSDTEKSGGGKRAAWGIALALCLLALVAAGVWHYRKPLVASAPAPIVNSSPAAVSSTTAVSPERVETPQTTSTEEANATEAAPARVAPRVSQEATRRSREAPVIARSVPPSAVPRTSVPPPYPAGAVTSAPVVRTPSAAGTAAAPPASSATSAPAVTRTGTTRPVANPPVPAAALSSRLGSSTIPAYAALPDADATTDGRRYPRLLRRRMPLSGSNNQVAELRAPGVSGNTPAIPVGTVRPTSLGIMAGNLLYSPTPAYPAAAAAAHVQGEVKVQAEIDRDGNVVSARVVSGPPMLRDAAVDAIQHWRYKPWTAGGKTVPTSAVAVVDFQLP